MMRANEFENELEKARVEYNDLLERGDEAITKDGWDDFEKERFSEEEIRESDFKAFIFGYYRQFHKDEVIDMDKFDALTDAIYNYVKGNGVLEPMNA